MNSQSREINSVRNISISIINQCISLILNFAAKSVFIKVLGEDYLGINGLFSNIFMLFSFAEFGIGSAMIYSLYNPIAKQDKSKISALYQYYKKLYRKMSLWISVVGLLVLPFLNIIVRTKSEIEGLYIYYLAFLFNTILYNMFSYQSNLIIADQKKYKVSIYQTIFDCLGMIGQIIVLLVTHNYLLYLLLTCLKTMGTYYVIGKEVQKSYGFIGQPGEVSYEDKIEITQNIKSLFIYKFARVLITGTDNIIISLLVGTVWVGYYSNYDLVVIGVSSLITIIFSALSASIGNLVAEKSVSHMYDIFKTVQVIAVWITGFTTICLIVLFQDFITLWLGEKYVLSFPIVAVIAFNYYLGCVRDSTKIFREAAGIFDKIKNTMIITAIMNLILSIVLGKAYGIFGVLIATTISILLTYYWYEPVLIYRSMNVNKVSEYFILQIISFILLLIGIFVTKYSTSFIKELTWASFLLKTLLCVIISNLYYLLILGHRKETKYVFHMLRRIFVRSR
jgi:O-antigen/teichoic acid export membrane protein